MSASSTLDLIIGLEHDQWQPLTPVSAWITEIAAVLSSGVHRACIKVESMELDLVPVHKIRQPSPVVKNFA